MDSLRSARLLARLALAWFVLAMGVAVAAPMVQPRGLDLVCVGGGLKLLQQSGDDEAPLAVGLDCPLCSVAAAPPPWSPAVPLLSPRPAIALAGAPTGPAAAALHTPPARGPPAQDLT